MARRWPHASWENGIGGVYFTGNNFSSNNLGYNPNVGIVYPEAARKRARRPTLNTPSDLSPASLQVAVKRVSLLLNKPEDYTPLVMHMFGKMEIHSYWQLYEAMADTWDNRVLAAAFKRQFEEASVGLILYHKQSSFFRCTSMYMDGRWEHDHEQFQQIIEREQRVNNEAVGGITTNLQEAI